METCTATREVMRFPAWREVSEPEQKNTPNTTVISHTVELITVPYSGDEPATIEIERQSLSDYADLPVDT